MSESRFSIRKYFRFPGRFPRIEGLASVDSLTCQIGAVSAVARQTATAARDSVHTLVSVYHRPTSRSSAGIHNLDVEGPKTFFVDSLPDFDDDDNH